MITLQLWLMLLAPLLINCSELSQSQKETTNFKSKFLKFKTQSNEATANNVDGIVTSNSVPKLSETQTFAIDNLKVKPIMLQDDQNILKIHTASEQSWQPNRALAAKEEEGGKWWIGIIMVVGMFGGAAGVAVLGVRCFPDEDIVASKNVGITPQTMGKMTPQTMTPATSLPQTMDPSTNWPQTMQSSTSLPQTMDPSTNWPQTMQSATNWPETMQSATNWPETMESSTNWPQTMAPSTTLPQEPQSGDMEWYPPVSQ